MDCTCTFFFFKLKNPKSFIKKKLTNHWEKKKDKHVRKEKIKIKIPKKKKKKKRRKWQKSSKHMNIKLQQFCPKHEQVFSFQFSSQIGRIEFLWARRENFQVLPIFSLFSPSNQTHSSLILSPIFSLPFSIYPVFTPNKHTLKNQ